ncbi:hypothetical protein AYO38_04770 [bacterium SCGC AG-212-C10]|nr:hypothetical protein AYO38_04770 [bacterium SCGC AG-212-C10]
MKGFTVIIERGDTSYGAYIRDLPGCVAVGGTLDEVKQLIREAMAFHIEGMREDGLPIPEPTSTAEVMELVS